MNTIVYHSSDNLYINLTNRCDNDCDFCVRNHSDGVDGYYLWLEKEPTTAEVIAELEKYNLTEFKNVVFCGFGEPTYRYDDMCAVAEYIHSRNGVTRLNTNGHARLILGKDITDDIGKYIDIINVSLNAASARKYDAVCHSVYGEAAFDALIEFARGCVPNVKEVILSVVDRIGENEIAAARVIADNIGVRLRVRSEI